MDTFGVQMMNYHTLIKNIVGWTIPPKIPSCLSNTIPKIRNNRFTDPELYKKFSENSKFNNIHKGERCFILATGPSINEQNLFPLKDELCISVSNFFLHPDAKIIDPLYHAFASNHLPMTFENLKKESDNISWQSLQDTTFFYGYIPYKYSYKNFLDKYPQYCPKKYYYINHTFSMDLNEDNFLNTSSWDISKNPFSERSVIYDAIQIAVYMGFDQIYLLGCDHDYLINPSHIEGPAHFYNKEQSPIASDVDALFYERELLFLNMHNRWKDYRLMKEYTTQSGKSIYNATYGGMLDVFPRVNLEELF